MPALADVPAPARILGLAGAIPFWVAAALFWFGPDAFWQWKALEVQIFYGVAILSFLGAVHWGVALRDGPEAEGLWPRLGWSVTPALIAWIASLMNPVPALATLIVGVAAAYFMDLRAREQGWLPGWYLELRKWLTILVVLSLAVSLVRLLGG